PALRKAAHFGIDARTLRDVRPEEFGLLLKLHYQESSFHSVLHHLKINLHAEEGDTGVPELTPEILAQLKANPSDARVFRLPNGQSASWNDQYKLAQREHHEALYQGIPSDGSPLRKNLTI